jgi:hypothetical protein
MLPRQLTSSIGELPQLVEWQMIQVQGIRGRDPVPIQNFIDYTRIRNRSIHQIKSRYPILLYPQRAAGDAIPYPSKNIGLRSDQPFIRIIHPFATPIFLLELRDFCFIGMSRHLKQIVCGGKFLPGNPSISKERF